ncbi:MAG: hypothetical protein F6K00_06795 [Leptolyngbya sp. SIOISBB]|nr:hypothetical protein [Leptolyngbya sp. SIOISBB]
MNRYLLAAVLGAIAFLALLGIGNGRDLLQQSRNTISSTPSSAAEGTALTGIESAGQNVLRQTSPEAIGILADGTTPPTPTLNPDATDNFNPADPNSTPPVSPSPTPTPQPAPAPATPPPTDQEAIPALW